MSDDKKLIFGCGCLNCHEMWQEEMTKNEAMGKIAICPTCHSTNVTILEGVQG
jgi:Zn finger protein HypA/HybF involved in hydrogenase expression